MLKSIIFSIIKLFPPEVSHLLVLKALKYNPLPKRKVKKDKLLETNLLGYKLSHPVGLAAGFDKNGEALNGILKLQFSFIEIGTVTPLAQNGNAKPRVFRFSEERGIINKLGFPNCGVVKLVNKLINIRKSHPLGSEPIIGVNIGCNKKSKDPFEDFIFCLKKVYKVADYITVNISSPNTPGLRNMQEKENLIKLLKKINKTRIILEKKFQRFLPIVIKISPDIDFTLLKDLINASIKYKLNGVIATNTTINKNVFSNTLKNIPNGGISGRPLLKKSNKVLKKVKKYSKNSLQIIGLGGVEDGITAIEKLKLGASAIQIYTGLIFKGPILIENILYELSLYKKSNKKLHGK
ncbi:MAG: Dihydroorotate dehydrogenase (quinone) [Alphaproteobacteria bacterium MarineAlpha9_Bin4]|nr:dihydroorotate dehydrogenase (quinone) [Pelagibacterales bacterium]PPR27647.1 MAG: Dihydroorotate dehydrogenase (quinone) [Alphaproteobacteria bacterium MarineAlpha9_Bin4]|tara:strand:- start:1461 stop:2513 length:1053 start_codon:yes stop_codon:yes gene_type:complete